jgi:signal transduction histidine kinase
MMLNASGYDIGLTIVKRLCDRFHWQIEVSSEAGKGTQCRLIFPDSEV